MSGHEALSWAAGAAVLTLVGLWVWVDGSHRIRRALDEARRGEQR